MGKREAAHDPDQDPTDEQWRIWEALHNRRKDEALNTCPPGYHEINVEGCQISCGHWLLQYFDLALGRRYSIGGTPDGRFFVLCLYDSDRHTTLDWFPDLKTIYLSLNISKDKWSSIASFANRKSR